MQADYIRREKTPFDMEEGVTTLAGHQVGRSQCKQFLLQPAGLYSMSSSIGSPFCAFQFVYILNVSISSAARSPGFFSNIDILALIMAGWKIGFGGIEVNWTVLIPKLDSFDFVGSGGMEIEGRMVLEMLGFVAW